MSSAISQTAADAGTDHAALEDLRAIREAILGARDIGLRPNELPEFTNPPAPSRSEPVQMSRRPTNDQINADAQQQYAYSEYAGNELIRAVFATDWAEANRVLTTNSGLRCPPELARRLSAAISQKLEHPRTIGAARDGLRAIREAILRASGFGLRPTDLPEVPNPPVPSHNEPAQLSRRLPNDQISADARLDALARQHMQLERGFRERYPCGVYMDWPSDAVRQRANQIAAQEAFSNNVVFRSSKYKVRY